MKTKYTKAQIFTRTVTFLTAEPQFKRHSTTVLLLWISVLQSFLAGSVYFLFAAAPLPHPSKQHPTCLHWGPLPPHGDHLAPTACASESPYIFSRLSCIYLSMCNLLWTILHTFVLPNISSTTSVNRPVVDCADGWRNLGTDLSCRISFLTSSTLPLSPLLELLGSLPLYLFLFTNTEADSQSSTGSKRKGLLAGDRSRVAGWWHYNQLMSRHEPRKP